ncbi:MAG: CPBP family intramembrane glutamic endopeptidase [Bacteroidales bacterium]|jgi:membrane protease YdiL (CAAX protease family)
MKTYLNKNFNWLWISAILLYLLSLLLGYTLGEEVSVQDNAILELAANLNGWLFLITVVVIAPILEEFSFRSWTINKKWTKYLSLVLSSFFIVLISPYAFIVYFLVFLLVLLLLKNKPKTHITALVIISSLGFVMAHSGNLELRTYLVSVPTYLAIALILCFMALRFKFRYAIFTHSLYNFILMLIGGFIIPFGSTVNLNEGNYTGTLTPVSGLYSQTKCDSYGGYSANIHRSMLPEIIALLNFDSELEIKTFPNGYRFYNLNVKNKDTISLINLKAISKELVKKCNIRIDTISELKEVYFLSVKNVEKIRLDDIDSIDLNNIIYPNTLRSVVSSLAKEHKIIIRVPEQYKGIMIRDNRKFYTDNLSNKTTIEQFFKNVEREYGFVLTPKQAEVQTIRIFEK